MKMEGGRKRRALHAVLSAACLLACGTAELHAQGAKDTAGFPNRPIRVVVPFTPGGQPDIVARMIGPKLLESLRQQFVVDNRPGAGGMIGTKIVASSAPDGYTLLSVSAAHAIGPAVRANLGYDPVKDFAGVTIMANAAYYLVIPNSVEARTVKEFIALAKAKAGQLNFSSAGVGSASHFGGEMFKHAAGIDVVHVPHKGIPEALTDVVAGRAHYFLAPFGSTAGLLKDGRLRALAVSTAQRARAHPELPTIAESGLPGFRYDSWNALYAPAKTPRAVINKLNGEVARALKFPDVEQRLLAIGIEPASSTPAELDKFTAEQVAASAELARRAGIKPE